MARNKCSSAFHWNGNGGRDALKSPFVLPISPYPLSDLAQTLSMYVLLRWGSDQLNSASIKLSVPGSKVQILTSLKPADSRSSRQFCFVRSLAEKFAIMTMSKPVLIQ